jgi:hypothetical protein
VHYGKCLCGKIKYEYAGEINEVSMCHCSQCRKAQGSAFAAVSPIESDKFKITEGEEYLKAFRSRGENKIRVFCSECGSPIYSARDDLPGVKRLRLGTLDTPVNTNNKYHIFIGSKADWFDLEDKHPKYDKRKA